MSMVRRDELLKCLTFVDAGLSAKDEVEQSSCYVFQHGRCWAFNDNVGCSAPLPAAMSEIECAVPAGELRGLLIKLDDEVFDVSLGDDDSKGQLILRMKRRRAGIRVDAEVRMPLSEITTAEQWTQIPDGFAEAVEAVRQVASDDEQLFVLTCVHLGGKGLEACDNYQAIRYRIDTGLKESVLVKRNDLVKIAKFDLKEWGVTDAWLHFRGSAGFLVSCRRWNQVYPDLGPLMKVEGCEGVLPKGLVEAVAKAEVFVDAKGDVSGLVVDLNPSRLLLRSEGPAGWYEERQKTEYSGEPLRFRIAPRLLREVCRRSDRCVIGEDRLRVVGDNFVYVSCLAIGEEKGK